MRRREFIALTGGAVAASSFTAARAQQRATPVIGFLNGSSATAYATYVQAFIHGLAETGYTVGEMLRSNTAGPRVNTIASPIWLKTSCVVGLLSLPRTRRQRTLQKAPLVASRLSFLPERIQSRAASWQAETDVAFDTLRSVRANALLVQPDAFLINKRIVALAAQDALPTMYQSRELVAAGGLMSYGSSFADQYRQMGVYVGKVLKGAKPAEMPVLEPVKFEMAINQKTAKALGLKLSDNLLSLADEVIE